MGTSRARRISTRERHIARGVIKGIQEIEERKDPVNLRKAVKDSIESTFGAKSGKNKSLLDNSIKTSKSVDIFIKKAKREGIEKAISGHIVPSKDMNKDLTRIVSEKFVPKDIYPEIRERMIRTHLRTIKYFLNREGGV